MKKFLILPVLAFIISCNTGTQTSENQNSDQPVLTETGQSREIINEPETRLPNGIPTLNNGQKWQADESTNANVDQMKTLVTEFKQGQKTTEEDYKQLQQNFTAALNKIVQQCKMKGADHDALHVWLEPLMADNKQLATATTKNEMALVVNQMNDRLAIYSKYFN